MLDLERFRSHAAATSLAALANEWIARVGPAGHLTHGDLPALEAAVAALPPAPDVTPRLGPVVAVGADDAPPCAALNAALTSLMPWRKGPFRIQGVMVDTEWRSDFKWARVVRAVPDLSGASILDVGCGNGYFGWRMLERGATLVVGLDPSPRFSMQHALVKHYAADAPNFVLPLKLEDVPAGTGAFDVVSSMGVLYHRRDGAAHLTTLASHLGNGGRLVLETLVLSAAMVPHYGDVLVPEGRYARMRNVWAIPSVARLVAMVEAAGFVDVTVADVTATTREEQRRTAWMTSHSLADFLDPDDPTKTVEGLPAPVRAVVVARRR